MAVLRADINHELLQWAREESGYPLEAIAKRLGMTVDKVQSWELGRGKPTVRQAQELARCFHRPFGVFFLPRRPSIPPLAAEYRRLPGVRPGVESPEFRLAVRLMSRRREVALELNDELGAVSPNFQLSAHIAEGAIVVGQRVRDALAVGLDEQFTWPDEWSAWRRWRSAVEDIGVLVFQFPKVPLAEARGVSLLPSPLPVIGINSREQAPGARVFTLMHELVHISLALGKEESVALHESRNDAAWAEVERFAEETASEALVPDTALRDVLKGVRVRTDSWTIDDVRLVARRFRITPLAMATRLRAFGAMSWPGYQQWTTGWEQYVATLPPRRGGIATPVDKALSRGGRPFARLVLEALDANRITAVDASRHLDLRFDHFDSLRGELRGTQRAGDAE